MFTVLSSRSNTAFSSQVDVHFKLLSLKQFISKMVKNSFNFPAHAAEHANARTKVRSEQPHIGAELIPVLHIKQDVFPDLVAVSFQRSIYDKLPALKLRSSDFQIQPHDWNASEQRHFAESIHKMIVNVPGKDLMGLAAEGNQMRLVLPSTREELHDKLKKVQSLKQIERSPHGGRKQRTVPKVLHSQLFVADMASIVQISIDGGMNTSGGKSRRGIQQLEEESIHQMREALQDMSVGLTFGSSTPKASKIISRGSGGVISQLRSTQGFGTAPIWYQQSMATGPPK
jgi:hypothetical protein